MALDEPKQDEKPVEIDGVKILVSEVIRPFIDGARIDYSRNWLNNGFTVSVVGPAC